MSTFLSSMRTLVLLTMALALTMTFAAGQTLKKDELKNLIANAKTAQDHQRIADHYTAKAKEYESEAIEHAEEAAKYKASPSIHDIKHPGMQATASHCESMARSLREAAKEARQLAESHEAMAKDAK